MLLSKPMKTKSDEMKGEKEKIKASSKKEGFPWGTDWQRGFRFFRFLCRIKQLIQSCRHKWSQELGETNARSGGAWNGIIRDKNFIYKKFLKYT